MLFASALLVSIATFIVDPETYVRFGILHLIAIATLILPLAAPLKEWNALLGLLVLTTAELLPASAQTTLLIPLGIPPDNFATVDYFPFLPWFGVILIGYAIGYFLYIRNLRWRKPEAFSILNSPAFAQPSLKLWPASKATAGRQFSILARWPGRHSLLLYLVHQPIILSVLHLIFGKPDL